MKDISLDAAFCTHKKRRSIVASFGAFFKRFFDIIFSLAVMLVFSPVFILASFFQLLCEGRPIFYASKRCTSPNREITVFKFRSMVTDATDPKYNLEKKYMKDGYLDVPPSSEVYTKIGRFLERTQIVESPQFIHVFLGQMSVIGNRPLPSKNLHLLCKHPFWEERFFSPAGITGISQVVGKHNLTSLKRLQLERMYSLVYREGNVLFLDVYIVYRTILLIFFGRSLTFEAALSKMRKLL